jgi:hypothetical protein
MQSSRWTSPDHAFQSQGRYRVDVAEPSCWVRLISAVRSSALDHIHQLDPRLPSGAIAVLAHQAE